MWDTDLPEINVETPYHAGMVGVRERGTLRFTVQYELRFNLNP